MKSNYYFLCGEGLWKKKEKQKNDKRGRFKSRKEKKDDKGAFGQWWRLEQKMQAYGTMLN